MPLPRCDITSLRPFNPKKKTLDDRRMRGTKYESFIQALQTQKQSFRSDRVTVASEWKLIEDEYKTIKQKSDPLVRAVGMPARDQTGRREERLAQRPQELRHIEYVKKTVCEPPPRQQTGLPWNVVRFKAERYSPFKAHAQNIMIGRSYPSMFNKAGRNTSLH